MRLKILPASDCGSEIDLDFHAQLMIPVIEGRDTYPSAGFSKMKKSRSTCARQKDGRQTREYGVAHRDHSSRGYAQDPSLRLNNGSAPEDATAGKSARSG